MDFLNIFPLGSFLFLTATLTGRIIYLRHTGIKVSTKAGKKSQRLLFFYPLFGLLFLIWVAELLRLGFQWPFILPGWLTETLLHSIIFKISGVTIISISLIFWVLTLFHFKRSLRFGLNEHNRGKLITSGIFSLSRNPFFLSIDLYFFGLALLHSSLFFITMASLTLVSIHFFILKEEKFLRKHYGEAYRKYAERAGRYL